MTDRTKKFKVGDSVQHVNHSLMKNASNGKVMAILPAGSIVVRWFKYAVPSNCIRSSGEPVKAWWKPDMDFVYDPDELEHRESF